MIQDQAASLREMARNGRWRAGPARPATGARVIAVSSGKGGVGKTNVVANLGITWARAGRRVVILDADLGLANVDVVMGVQPQLTLADFLAGNKRLDEILLTGPEGVRILPGASGLEELANLDALSRERLIRALGTLDRFADVILIDTAAGIGANVSSFALAAREGLVVTTPEPTAFTDAYALIKVIAGASPDTVFKLVVNQAENGREAEEVSRKVMAVARHFLHVQVEDYGYLPVDSCVAQAVRRQVPAVVAYPRSAISGRLFTLSQRLWDNRPSEPARSAVLSFFESVARRTAGAGQ